MNCYQCGKKADSMASTCAGCGSWHLVSGLVKPTKVRTERSQKLPWPWSQVGWPRGVAMITGAKGSGKSSLAGILRPSLYLSTEQEPSEVASLLRRIQGKKYKAPWIGQISTLDELADALRQPLGASPVVVLDSVTELGLDEAVDAVKMLRAWCDRHQARALVVAQRTKDGSAAGRERLPHLVDVVADVHTDEVGLRRLSVAKNRHGDLTSTYFTVGALGLDKPHFSAAYSVEGTPGNYALVPHPTQGALWAGWCEADNVDLEGKAGAARRAPRYTSGWLVPEDTPQRRQFAEAHGLIWHDPRG